MKKVNVLRKRRETTKCFRNDSGSRSEGKETKINRLHKKERQKMKIAYLKDKQKE